MNRKRTFAGLLVTGIILAGFPLGAIARHNYIQEQDIHFEVISAISPRAGVENFDIWSELNFLDLSELSGGDSFLRGQTVYVHMSKGPGKVAYPFAVTSAKPETNDKSVFAVKGKVTGRQNGSLQIRYNFETFLPPNDLKNIMLRDPNKPSTVILALNDQGVPRLVSIQVDGKSYPYRKMDVPSFSFSGLAQK